MGMATLRSASCPSAKGAGDELFEAFPLRPDGPAAALLPLAALADGPERPRFAPPDPLSSNPPSASPGSGMDSTRSLRKSSEEVFSTARLLGRRETQGASQQELDMV